MQQKSWLYLPFIRLFMAALLLMASGGEREYPSAMWSPGKLAAQMALKRSLN
jgi:hypothetical protein